MIEFELKFQIAPDRAEAVQAAVARGSAQTHQLLATYFDTPDAALANRRIVLRMRQEDGAWMQTAKAPGEGLVGRLEHNAPVTASAREVPMPTIDRHEGTPLADALRHALEDCAPDTPLLAVYTTDVRRIARSMRTGDAQVELAFDRGVIRAQGRERAVCELELELKSGSPHALIELAQRWVVRYGVWIDTASKSARGLQLASGEEHSAPLKARPPRLQRGMDGPQVLRAILAACMEQILGNASEVGNGSPDPSHVHQLRVGLRRLRTLLRELPDLGDIDIDPAWEPVLRERFRALGNERDLTQLRELMQPRIEAAGSPPLAWPAPTDAGASEAARVVRDPIFQRVLLGLVAATLPPEAPDADEGQAASDAVNEKDASSDAERPPSLRKRLRAKLDHLHRQVLRDGRRFETLDEVAQHRVRKRLKRLRYLAEFVAPLFDAERAQRYLSSLTPAQDALGDHNDAVIAIERYRERAAQDCEAWFAVGWLSRGQAESAEHCREALAAIAKAEPFWKRGGKHARPRKRDRR